MRHRSLRAPLRRQIARRNVTTAQLFGKQRPKPYRRFQHDHFGDLWQGDAMHSSLLPQLRSTLYDLARKGRYILLIVDEAHPLSAELFDQFRFLLNDEMDSASVAPNNQVYPRFYTNFHQ